MCNCKKKKEPPVITTPDQLLDKELREFIDNQYSFTEKEIVSTYHELTNMKGVNDIHKPLISTIYFYLFNETFDWNCGGCVSVQARKYLNYLNSNNISL